MSALYDTDFYGWAVEQAQALREAEAARLNTPRLIDWANIAEELDGLARKEARELRSRYRTLLLHLLKWQLQHQRRGSSWEITIRRERDDIPDLLAENPSLLPRREELFAKAYRDARYDAAKQMRVSLRRLPETCPFTLEQAMDPDFWPE